MSEKIPQEYEGSRQELLDFYKFVTTNLPDGLIEKGESYTVTVEGLDLQVAVYRPGPHSVKIGLFDPGEYMARKILEIDKDGIVTESTPLVTPDILAKNKSKNEAQLSGISNEELAISVTQQIRNYKRPGVN